MLAEIKKVLKETPGLKGREIANKLKKDKKEVNSYLLRHNEGLYQEDYKWYLESTDTVEWKIECGAWLTCEGFEQSYSEIGNLVNAQESNIVIQLPKGFKILLIAGARLISLANYLNHIDKNVTLDFELCKGSMSYLDRLGFFDHIHCDIKILPNRPATSRAKQYKGNSNNLVEIGEIDLNSFNEELPEELTAAFTSHAGKDYYMAAFTVFSELIGNVQEHSETPIPGFAALQFYEGKNNHHSHVQTVISDHGLGLSNTLKENLHKHYPKLASTLDLTCVESDIKLIIKALTDGKLSRFGHNPDGVARGLGLKRSQDYALKYNAEVTVRQENLIVKLEYCDGKLTDSTHRSDLGYLAGTHVCFDFILK
ncbi:ATP-binding protein [Catenovulum sp. 2E275]|uniref:ATP-binding protein n=1 Tax=Catenovulum sp. 2E275 TaxID=2980497 RepID=UPI0021D12A5F|nr:ATP-binding protein [Catenovulum sp. 2E275]MCU4676200.1 ATP-binding protein [Catenovulum sp. 2E275]